MILLMYLCWQCFVSYATVEGGPFLGLDHVSTVGYERMLADQAKRINSGYLSLSKIKVEKLQNMAKI